MGVEREMIGWNEIYSTHQNLLTRVCLIALLSLLFLFASTMFVAIWKESRTCVPLKTLRIKLFLAFLVCGIVQYGATKQRLYVGYDGGIKAGATANVVTNDTVSIYWQRDTSGGVYVPDSAAVYIDYRPKTETDTEWVSLAQTTVGAWGWSGTVENATNYDYSVWAYYIPPEPVHTNGVWTYKTHFDRNSDFAIPLRARIEVNGKAIATPKEVREDEED